MRKQKKNKRERESKRERKNENKEAGKSERKNDYYIKNTGRHSE